MADTLPAGEPITSRLAAIARELTAAGFDTRMHQTRAAADLTATIQPHNGRREVEAVIDEDGYTELRFWHPDSATPEQVSALITGALAVITAAPHA